MERPDDEASACRIRRSPGAVVPARRATVWSLDLPSSTRPPAREAIMYSRILVPIDGSNCSLKGLTEAVKLAGLLKARLKLVHVVNELISEPALAPSEYHDRLIETLREG